MKIIFKNINEKTLEIEESFSISHCTGFRFFPDRLIFWDKEKGFKTVDYPYAYDFYEIVED